MSKGLITRETMDKIANAIRFKLNENNVYYPYEMPNKILSIPSDGGQYDYIVTIAEDGKFDVVCYKSVLDNLFSESYIDTEKRIKTVTFDNNSNLVYIGINAFSDCSLITELNFPPNIKEIKSGAFAGTGIMNLKIPDTVEVLSLSQSDIGGHFSDCYNLTDLNIGNGIDNIPSYCFMRCPNLTYVQFGENIEVINNNAFDRCSSLESLDFPLSLKTINSEAFSRTGIINLNIIDNIEYIYDSFLDCDKLNTVMIGKGLKDVTNLASSLLPLEPSIRVSPFRLCNNLSNISIDSENQIFYMTDGAFCDTDGTLLQFVDKNTTEFNVPENIFKISFSAFDNNNILENITLPNQLKEISSRSFRNCTKLKNVHIPSSVLAIGSSAFYGCVSLESIYIHSIIPPKIDSATPRSVFGETNDCPIYVPSASLSNYKTDTYWSVYKDRLFGF